jgi:hypothetical protein
MTDFLSLPEASTAGFGPSAPARGSSVGGGTKRATSTSFTSATWTASIGFSISSGAVTAISGRLGGAGASRGALFSTLTDAADNATTGCNGSGNFNFGGLNKSGRRTVCILFVALGESETMN